MAGMEENQIINDLEALAERMDVKGIEGPADLIRTAAAIITGQAERLRELEAETKPRMLTFEELGSIYNTTKGHLWPFPRAPYLWLERPAVSGISGQWVAWREVRGIMMYQDLKLSPMNYGKKWVLFTMAPSRQQRDAIPWEKTNSRPSRLV